MGRGHAITAKCECASVPAGIQRGAAGTARMFPMQSTSDKGCPARGLPGEAVALTETRGPSPCSAPNAFPCSAGSLRLRRMDQGYPEAAGCPECPPVGLARNRADGRAINSFTPAGSAAHSRPAERATWPSISNYRSVPVRSGSPDGTQGGRPLGNSDRVILCPCLLHRSHNRLIFRNHMQ